MANRYRSAHYLGCASESVMAEVARNAQIKPRNEQALPLSGLIEFECGINESVFINAVRDATRDPFLTLPKSFEGVGVWSCDYAHPHKDDMVGDITIGLVISGDHELYTGLNKRTRFALKPGTVYMLSNKKMHGASRASENSERLVFAAKDMHFESMRDAFIGLGLK